MSGAGTAAAVPERLLRRSTLLVLGAAGSAGALCILYLSMRSVMEIGGSCASGNTPYAIENPCPKGVPGLMTGSIFAGFAFLTVYALNTFSFNLVLLAWPALFLSLGWNFFDYGLDPPGEGGAVAGWLICGVVFALMGGVPLVIGIMAALKERETPWSTPDRDKLRERLKLSVGKSSVEDAEERKRQLRWLSIALHVAGIGLGLWGAIELFEWATGADVSLGFR